MPSLRTAILTSALTITTFVTLSSALPGSDDVITPIEGLSDCAQSIVFTCLSESKCSPSDYHCVCKELHRLDIKGKVGKACSAADLTQYASFAEDICHPKNVTSTTVIPCPVCPDGWSTSTVPVPIATGYSNVTNVTSVPTWTNVTTTVVGPIQVTTSPVVVATTNAAGEPTTVTTSVVKPVATVTGSGPEFTGAASPEFGSARAGWLAGAVGIMGLVFAEL